MDLESVVNRFVLSPEAILERVDEYTLYCHYLGFEPLLRTPYKSNIRKENSDESPSFSMFASTKFPDREYAWKDSGGKGTSGDIFVLVKLLYGYAKVTDAYKRIDIDFNLGFGSKEPGKAKIVLHTRPENIASWIGIKSKQFTKEALQYWEKYGITYPQLVKYNVKQVSEYWLMKDQDWGYKPKSMMFAYGMQNRYQLYQPKADKEYKFRQNLNEFDLHGFSQLEYNYDTLVITKARKDVMCLDMLKEELKAEFVAPRSETTPVHPKYLRFLETKYKHILVLFDNDGKHKAELYPYPLIQIPLSSGYKDPSDFRAAMGKEQTVNLIKQLINNAKA